MSEAGTEAFNLDTLLEDLNQATKMDAGPATIKFIPHRPVKEKSPSQTNPKARFAVNPDAGGSSFSNPPSPQSPVSTTVTVSQTSSTTKFTPKQTSAAKEPSSFDKDDFRSPTDDDNIDNLLDMLASPTPAASNNSNTERRPSITPIKDEGSSTTTIFSKSSEKYGGSRNDLKDSNSLPVNVNQRLNFSNAASTASSSSSGFSSSGTTMFPSTSGRINNSISSQGSGSLGGFSSSSSSSSLPTAVPSVTAGARKCTKVVLAGASHSRGIKLSAFSKCACDNLRCLQCNFRVHSFANACWASDVDYMFFRNNVPNESKLQVKLVRSEEGSFAYCCQCSWTSAFSEKALVAGGSGSDPQWVCAGHV